MQDCFEKKIALYGIIIIITMFISIVSYIETNKSAVIESNIISAFNG